MSERISLNLPTYYLNCTSPKNETTLVDKGRLLIYLVHFHVEPVAK